MKICKKFCGFILKFPQETAQEGSMELFEPRDLKSSMIRHRSLNLAELEMSTIRAKTITPQEFFGKRNVSRRQKFDMGCKCGLGIMGEFKKDESRIVNGYLPEKRPWMVDIKVNFKNSQFF